MDTEYTESNIRQAVIEIANNQAVWKGRCATLINDAIELGIPITESPKHVGGFLHRHQGRFLDKDGVKITITSEGTASKTYRIQKTTIGTIGESEEIPLVKWEEASEYGPSEIPFL
jgi:hypothetical protein